MSRIVPAEDRPSLVDPQSFVCVPAAARALAIGPPRAVAVEPRTQAKTIRVGLLGLGQVGQAVARLAPEVRRLRDGGLRFSVASALVRDVEKPRRCPRPARITSNPAAFLRGGYDVVIEALGTIEPARTLVARLLGRGIPVVTANKALVAAHGRELSAIARRRGTTLRYEASALAGVPFLGALAERPFFADITRFTAIVNGTSNFILSAIDRGESFEAALKQAQALGLTEPDPSRDLDGLDAADKLALLGALFGWGTLGSLELQGIRAITPADLAAARQIGATIKPMVAASREDDRIDAFVAPALVPLSHPLAPLSGTLSGIQLSGRFISDLLFSGPGAGPDITAATVLDDAIEAVSTVRKLTANPKPLRAVRVSSPSTGWFVRTQFPGLAPEAAIVRQSFASCGLAVEYVSDVVNETRWVRVGVASRDHVTSALTRLKHTHRLECLALRAV